MRTGQTRQPPRATWQPAESTIAVVAFAGMSPFHLSVPCLVFGEDRQAAGIPLFKLLVCAAERVPLLTSAGFTITAPYSLRDLARAQTIIVPTWRDAGELPPAPLLQALRRAHARGAQLVGLCLGAFVLAAAGLLDGRPATTHWLATTELTRRYPRVRANPDVLYVDDGDIVTSAGTAAGLDCCLHLVRRQLGAEIANRLARRLVISPHRQGGQAQYIEHVVPVTTEPTPLSLALQWAERHLDAPLPVELLAKRACMSRRTFTRHFRQTMGTTLGKWLVAQRLALAQRLLETTAQPIERVAESAGFGSAVSLRQQFGQAFATSPLRYRNEFRGG